MSRETARPSGRSVRLGLHGDEQGIGGAAGEGGWVRGRSRRRDEIAGGVVDQEAAFGGEENVGPGGRGLDGEAIAGAVAALERARDGAARGERGEPELAVGVEEEEAVAEGPGVKAAACAGVGHGPVDAARRGVPGDDAVIEEATRRPWGVRRSQRGWPVRLVMAWTGSPERASRTAMRGGGCCLRGRGRSAMPARATSPALMSASWTTARGGGAGPEGLARGEVDGGGAAAALDEEEGLLVGGDEEVVGPDFAVEGRGELRGEPVGQVAAGLAQHGADGLRGPFSLAADGADFLDDARLSAGPKK